MPAGQRQALVAEADRGRVLVGGEDLAVEMAARLVSVPVAARYLGSPATRGEYLNPYAFAALRGNGSETGLDGCSAGRLTFRRLGGYS